MEDNLINLINRNYKLFESNRIENGFNKSLKNVIINEKIDLNVIINDLDKIKCNFKEPLDNDFEWRIKALKSVELKIEKYIKKKESFSAKSVLNDLVGYRIKCNQDKKEIINILSNDSRFRVVNMLEGKNLDDGYRAIHLYPSENNIKYQYEIQIWFKEDFNYNLWMHKYTYKQENIETSRILFKKYLNGEINSEDDFVKNLKNIKSDIDILNWS